MELVRDHTERFTKETLTTLLNTKGSPCVSLYLPTHKTSNEADQDPIRLKNLLSEAENILATQEMRTPDIVDLLSPVQDLIDNRELWQHQSHGLAIFRTHDHFEYYRLPLSFDEMVVSGDRFYIKPLLPLLSGNGHFYLLSLSQNAVRFFEGTRFRIGEVALNSDTPTSLAEAMRFDDFESQFQFHTRTSQGGNGRNSAMFYGMEDAGDEAIIKENIKRFLRTLDNDVIKQITDEKAPLLLAGVEYMRGLYREVAQYDHILPDGIEGNPENFSLKEIQQQAWPIVEPHFQQELTHAMDIYQQLNGSGDQRASFSLDDIVSASYYQRVNTLFIACGMQRWGEFDPEENRIERHDEKRPNAYDLLDFAAAHTILNGGAVFVLHAEEMPNGAEIAATFRY